MFQHLRPSRLTLQGAAISLGVVTLMSCIRPLGVLFLVLFCYWLYLSRCSFRIVLTPRLRVMLDSWQAHYDNWRRDYPSIFCFASIGCLVGMAIMGHLISGSTLMLSALIISALVSTRYNLSFLQIEHKDYQWSVERISYSHVEPELDDEFMPDVNAATMFLLERASDVTTLSSPTDADCVGDDDECSDDIPSELLIPDSIPEIDEQSTDEDDELVPVTEPMEFTDRAALAAAQLPYKPNRPFEVNPYVLCDKIEFHRGHFKCDSSMSTSSSSSEECLSKGLQFPDHTNVDADGPSHRQLAAPLASTSNGLFTMAVKTQVQSLLPTLMSNLVKWGTKDVVDTKDNAALAKYKRRQVTALDSSDESDFEILETDDFK